MRDTPSRREELIAGALTGDLSEDEWSEFEQARAADPTIDTELAELRGTVARLDVADVTWREESVDPSLEERIRSGPSEARRDGQDEDGRSTYSP